jgi:hypothetical protein
MTNVPVLGLSTLFPDSDEPVPCFLSEADRDQRRFGYAVTWVGVADEFGIRATPTHGVRDFCTLQWRAKLRSAHGDNDTQNFITNLGAQIVFAPREQSYATDYSEMPG